MHRLLVKSDMMNACALFRMFENWKLSGNYPHKRYTFTHIRNVYGLGEKPSLEKKNPSYR